MMKSQYCNAGGLIVQDHIKHNCVSESNLPDDAYKKRSVILVEHFCGIICLCTVPKIVSRPMTICIHHQCSQMGIKLALVERKQLY